MIFHSSWINIFFEKLWSFIWTQKCTSVIKLNKKKLWKLLKELRSNWAPSRIDWKLFDVSAIFSRFFHKYSIKMCIVLKIWFCILVWIVFSFSLSCFQFWLNFSSILPSLVNDLYKFGKSNYTLIRNEVRKILRSRGQDKESWLKVITTGQLMIKIFTDLLCLRIFYIEIQRHYGISPAIVW